MSEQNKHDLLRTQKHIPVVNANSFKDQNEQRSVLRGGKRAQSQRTRLGPGSVGSDQPACDPRCQGRGRSPAAPKAAPQANQASERTQSQGLPQRLHEAVTVTHRSDRFVLTCGSVLSLRAEDSEGVLAIFTVTLSGNRDPAQERGAEREHETLALGFTGDGSTAARACAPAPGNGDVLSPADVLSRASLAYTTGQRCINGDMGIKFYPCNTQHKRKIQSR